MKVVLLKKHKLSQQTTLKSSFYPNCMIESYKTAEKEYKTYESYLQKICQITIFDL